MVKNVANRRPNVALLIETSSDYTRRLLRGIMAYIRENRPWTLCQGEYRRGQVVPADLKQGRCDGIIARIENKQIARVICEQNIPAVDVSSGRLVPSIPCVETDDRGIARLAAEHLMERGFRHFGFVGDDYFGWSKSRRAYFQRDIAAAGFDCSVYLHSAPGHAAGHWNVDRASLDRWVQRLPQPVGVMAGWDGYGHQVLESCRRCGVAVPDEVAVIGVDNDEMECELANPPLSSVDNNSHQIGYECAAILDRMMSGRKVKPKTYVIPPTGVVMRQSTDVLAIEDRRIVAAVRVIREHACEGISVDDILQTAGLSRRMLESCFRKYLGHSPHQEILRVKLQHVKKLLAETNLTLVDIAERAGFEYQEYMSVVFKRVYGKTPGEYRKPFKV